MKTRLLELTLAFVGLTLSIAVFAQSKWVYSYGSYSMDEALCSDSHGSSYFVGGYFSQGMPMGGVTQQSNGFSDGFLTKMDGQGAIDWVQTIGGSGADRILDVHAHSNGQTAVTGFITGTVTVDGQTLTTNAGTQDAFVMLCDPQGAPLWVIALGGEDADTGYGVSMDDAGNVYCTGQFKGHGQFGPFNLLSVNNPLEDLPSHDIFVVKISPSGTVLWAKHGAANYDDRGLSICNDPAGNLYLAGQSSDTLYFENNSYPNDVINSGFILKIDSNGNEQWFTRLAAFQTLINEIEYGSDDHLYLTGDHIGQMAVLSSGTPQFFPPVNSYNIFLAKFDLNGQVEWLSNAGSENEASSKSLCEGENGEWYIAGTFKCRMTSFSELYGEGVFYSLGYRDVFLARYNADGSRVWERNYASPKDDFCAAVEYGGEDDPLFFGSYGTKMRFPNGAGFGPLDDTVVPWWVGTMLSYCGDTPYGSFRIIEAEGGLDIFMARSVILDREPLDWFDRQGQPDCTRDFREVCLNPFSCPDTISNCGYNTVNAYTYTLPMSLGGPDIEIEWTGNLDIDNVSEPYTADSYFTQWVYFQIDRADGCYSSIDSIYTIAYPYPPEPLLSDDVVVNTECTQCATIDLCLPQVITLTATGITEDTYGWGNPYLPGQTTFATAGPGIYTFFQTNEFGCSTNNHIQIQFAAVPDSVAPYMKWATNGFIIGQDSVGLCPQKLVWYELLDSMNVYPGVEFSDGEVLWRTYFNEVLVHQSTLPSENNYIVPYQSDGWHVVHAVYTEIFCDEPTVTYPLLIDSIYIEAYPGPDLDVFISGPTVLCPGGSEILTANGGTNYTWSGPDLEVLDPESIEIFAPGNYHLNATVTNEFGCSSTSSDQHYVQNKTALISMLPANGIVCPFDSVLLFTNIPHLSYQWIGPMGELLGTEQEQWVELPGLYHCQVLDVDSCYLETNFLEVKEYSSPYLESFPGTDLCVGGEVELTVYSNEEAQIQWMSPLSGSSNQQVVDEPGTYTVQSTLCGITTELQINIVLSIVPAEIQVLSELPACPGDTVILQANPGMSFYDWDPGGVQGQQIGVTEPGTYNLTTIDSQGCLGFAEPVEIDFINAVANITLNFDEPCPGETVSLEAEGTGLISWYVQPDDEAQGTGPSFEFVIDNEPVLVGVSSTIGDCESPANYTLIELHPSAYPPALADDADFCTGEEMILVSDSGELIWSGPGGTYTGEEWDLGPAESELEGTYEINYVDNQCGSAPGFFEVEVHLPAEVELSMENDTICDGQENILIAPPGLSDIQWFPINASGDSLFTGIEGSYWIVALDANGCQVISDTLSFDVQDSPDAPPAIDTLACVGTNVVLSSGYEGLTLWYHPFTGDTVGGATFMLFSLDSDVETWYQVVNELGCGSAAAPVFIDVPFSELPVSIDAPEWICEGSDLVLSTSTVAEQYLWTFPDDVEQGGPTLTFESVDTSLTGNYQLIVGTGPCVANSEEVFIEVIDLPEIIIDEERFDCIGGIIVMQSPPGMLDPVWNDSFEGESFIVQEEGWQYLEGYFEPGCAVLDSIFLATIDCEDKEANIFTPNNDGVNDYYSFSMWSYDIESVRIYNRWGNLVAEINASPFIWDGTNSEGEDLAEGAYFITLRSRVQIGGSREMRGVVQLVR